MSSLLKDAQCAASEGLEYASETAEEALDSAKKGAATVKGAAERSASSMVGTALKGFSTVAGIMATLRHLDLDDGLAWIGLARRRNPLATFAVFGTGVLVGAGIGCLIAPVSGAEARRAIREGFDDYMQRGANAVRRGEQELEKIENKAEKVAAKAASEVKNAASEVKQEVKHAASEVKQVASDMKQAVTGDERPNGRTTPNAMRS